MKKDGKSIIIITHKLYEVLSISDRVAILRKGEYIGAVDTGTTNQDELTEMMVGRPIVLEIERPEVERGEKAAQDGGSHLPERRGSHRPGQCVL